MRKGARDSQVVNNFFTFASIVIISITITLYTKYIVDDEDKALKVQTLPCQKDTFTKVTLFNKELLKKSQKALNKGYYKIEGSYLKKEQNSVIESVISLDEVQNYYIELIKIKPKKDIEKFLKIKFELIENEQSKKNKRIGAGTLISSFRINSKELLRFESDFNFMYKNAIKQRVECSMKVYENYVKN